MLESEGQVTELKGKVQLLEQKLKVMNVEKSKLSEENREKNAELTRTKQENEQLKNLRGMQFWFQFIIKEVQAAVIKTIEDFLAVRFPV